MLSLSASKKQLTLFLLSFAVLLYWFSPNVVQTSGPLIGGGDIDVHEHLGYLFLHQVSFFPVPHFHFFSSDMFYPYGIMSGLQAWFLEAEYLQYFTQTKLGPGPWLQWYALLSIAISGVGTYLLLSGQFSFVRSAVASFIVSFLNFYVVHKYPAHLNISLCHWTVLNLVCDFVVLKRYLERGQLTLRMLLLRVLLLFLAIGQDLGYVAGYALTSFVLTSLFIGWDLWKRKHFGKMGWWKQWVAEAKSHIPSCIGFAVAIAVLAWLYVPICVQLLLLTKKYPITTSQAGSYWANPIRFLFPWFPFFNPGSSSIDLWLHDSPDCANPLGTNSPGWTLLVLGGWGLVSAFRARDRAYLPLFALLVFCVLQHPQSFAILKMFPWFSMARVSGRSSIIYPAIAALLFLAIPNNKRWVFGFIGALAIVEVFTAYRVCPLVKVFDPKPQFFSYMKKVEASKGEAILDWPFCIASGNYVAKGLCRHRESLGNYALQRFHHKKVIGLNFGRLTPEIAAPYLESGWNFLIEPNPARGAANCFTAEEWKFFDEFYVKNDFAGIQLHEALLDPKCTAEFIAKYGKPSAETDLPASGRALYLPKQEAERRRLDAAAGIGLVYEPETDLKKASFVGASGIPYAASVDGIGGLETREGALVLPVLEKSAALKVTSRSEQTVILKADIRSRYPHQSVELLLNGKRLETVPLSPTSSAIIISLPLRRGRNELRWNFAIGGNWADCFKWYREAKGTLAIVNVSAVHRFYKNNRHEPAIFTSLEILEK